MTKLNLLKFKIWWIWWERNA